MVSERYLEEQDNFGLRDVPIWQHGKILDNYYNEINNPEKAVQDSQYLCRTLIEHSQSGTDQINRYTRKWIKALRKSLQGRHGHLLDMMDIVGHEWMDGTSESGFGERLVNLVNSA